MIGYRSYGQGKTTIRKYKFKYNKEKDWYVCPETGAILPYTGRIDRNGYGFFGDGDSLRKKLNKMIQTCEKKEKMSKINFEECPPPQSFKFKKIPKNKN